MKRRPYEIVWEQGWVVDEDGNKLRPFEGLHSLDPAPWEVEGATLTAPTPEPESEPEWKWPRSSRAKRG